MRKNNKFKTIVQGLSKIDPYHDFRTEEWGHLSIQKYYNDIIVYADKRDLFELLYATLERLEIEREEI